MGVLAQKLWADLRAAQLFADLRETALFDPTKLYALASLSAANHYRTDLGGGEAGINTGFGLLWVLRPRAITATFQGPGSRRNNGGWQVLFASSSSLDLLGYLWNSTSTFISPTFKFPTARLNRILLLWLQFNGTQARLMLDRLDTIASLAQASYTPGDGASREYLGTNDGSNYGSTDIDVLARLAWRGTPTDAHLIELADLVRAKGDVPTPAEWTRATITHRQSLREELAKLAVPVIDGQLAPASLPDTVTAASVDAMARQGSPVVRVIDPSVDGRKTYGALGFSATNYLEGATFPGVSAAFRAAGWVTFNSLPGASSQMVCCANVAGTRGFWLQTDASNRVLFYGANGTATANATLYQLTAADLGRPMYFEAVYTGTGLLLYVNGVATGSEVALSFAHANAGELLTVGHWKNTQPLLTGSVWNVSLGLAAPSAAEVVQCYADTVRMGRLQPIPGKTTRHYDLTADIVASGGDVSGIVPATVQDRIGTDHLTKVGQLYVAQRAERLFSYETSPILYGAGGFGSGISYVSAAGGEGNAAGFGVTIVWCPTAAGASVTRVLLSSVPTSPVAGFDIRATLTNALIGALMGDVSGSFRFTPTGSITALYGKVNVFTALLDVPAGRFRGFLNRAEIGSGTVIPSAYAPSPGGVRLGGFFGTTSNPASESEVYGFEIFDGLASSAQIQAQHDAILASDGIIQPCPGMLSKMRVDVTADARANGGVLPATLIDRASGNNLARVGSPTTAARYARAFGF